MSKPMISIVIPVYNGEKYISQCLDSICKQDNDDFEIIVINDGSKDNTLTILQSYAEKIVNFTIISKENGGQAIARNIGMDKAKGEYICFIDGDDRVEPTYLSELYDTISGNDADLVVSRIRRQYDYKPSLLEINFSFIHSVLLDRPTLVSEQPEILTQIQNAPYAKLIRLSFLKENHIRFMEGKLYEDLLFTQTLLLSNPIVISCDNEGYVYQVHKNTSMSVKDNRILDMFEVFDELIEFAKGKGIYEEYHDEIEYLALYHIGIGTMYRLVKNGGLGILKSREICRNYLKRNGFYLSNKYAEKQSVFIKLFLKMEI